MFIGHYGPALTAKALDKRIPLWLLFLAVQWLDVVWSVLVMLGVEKLRIVKGLTEGSSLDLYYMPYTHGLIGAAALSAALGAVTALFFRDRRAAVAAVVAGAVFSHWVLDLVVHVPDLPLLGDSFKVGFGLWRFLWISFPLEIAILIAGAAVYARAVPSKTRQGDTWLWGFVGVMAALQAYGSFGPAPESPLAQAQLALFAYFLLAGLAALVDWARGPVRFRTGTARLKPAG
ncbi:MAG TPA: hypothetical protein VHZ78_04580 [Rhizomicrobium sp.]|jgi:hypothetical protein|nr:hypothetical protein [Rhizomicrobium sp.]